jgi:hypothetical protein
MDKDEYKFPDEIDETKASAQEDEDEFVVEIEDDTPEEDRGKEPLPKDIVNSLEAPEEGGEYPEEVIVKFKQYKKAWHDERREKEAAFREQEEALRIAQSILEENKRLKATLSSGEQEYIATVKAAAETEVEVAKRNYREAYDSGDAEKLVDAQEALMQASLKLDRTKNFKPTLQDDETEVQLPQRSQADNKPQQVDPKFADWQRRNSNWFQKDEEMTDAAMGLHKKLYREYGPEYIGTDDYYERIDKTIRKRFPEAFPNGGDSEPPKAQKSRPSTVVASARRSTAPKQVKLTATQAALAKKFKLTPEQYAREVLKLQEN